MERIGIGFWLGMLVSAVLTYFGVYTVFLGMQVGDEKAPWLLALVFPVSLPLLFGVFRILSIRFPLIRHFYIKATGNGRSEVRKATGTYRPEVVRFVPHWYMMGAIVIVGLAVLFGLIRWILSLLGR
jgi:hypothetical protein